MKTINTKIIYLWEQFQGYILKPAYNSVDMIEVELLDDDKGARDFNPVLLTVSFNIIIIYILLFLKLVVAFRYEIL